MNQDQIKADVLKYLKSVISTELLPAELSDDFPLLESGAIDSLELFKMIAHLEDAFGIEIKPEEIVPDNFSTVHSIIEIVHRHLP